MSRSRASAKAAGTRAESAIAAYLRENGFPYAERRAKTGAKDQGDIAGLLGGVIEVKDCAKLDLAGWLGEALDEQANANAWWSAVWHKRRGHAKPDGWYVTMRGDVFLALLQRVYGGDAGAAYYGKAPDADS